MELKVLDYAGHVVRQLEAKNEPGLHRSTWDLARLPQGRPTGGGGAGGGRGGAGPGGPGGFGGGPAAQAGTYRIVLTVDGQEYTQGLTVVADPTVASSGISADQEEEFDEREREKLEEK